METSLELLSRAAIQDAQHEAERISKLPAKKKLLTQLKLSENAIQNQTPPMPSSLSIIPINSKDEPMEQDDDDVEINVQDDDSPLDMRITKHDDDSYRPSVIRRAPSFKETSNDPTSTCDHDLDEHFRRSLGTDYDLIIRNKLEQEQLALQKQRMIEEQILQQQQEAALLAQRQQQQQQHQQTNILKHHKKNQIHQHQAMLAAKNSQAKATPPPSPSPPIPAVAVVAAAPQKQVIITEQQNEDVDDHFAKALGDKWKQFQGDGK